MAPSGALRAAPRNALESREHPRLRAGSLSNAETETRPLHGAPGTVCPKAASAARGGRTWGAEGVAPAVSEAERRREGSAGTERVCRGGWGNGGRGSDSRCIWQEFYLELRELYPSQHLQSSSNNENDTKMVFLKEFERHLAQPSRDTSRPLYCCRLILSNGWPFSKTKVTWLKHVLAI